MKILIKKGDITREDTDAIVNPANSAGIMGGGVAGAIKRAGGKEIEDEARAKAPGIVGEAWVTGAGRLPARYVIHAATMALDFKTDEEKIRLATRNAMRRACETGAREITFPAMGTGVGGFPVAEAARIMREEILSFANNPSAPQEVRIVLFDQESFRIFASVFPDGEVGA
ncbi:MAG: macro domain-containing protein [candidate division WOR-3 bacterium]